MFNYIITINIYKTTLKSQTFNLQQKTNRFYISFDLHAELCLNPNKKNSKFYQKDFKKSLF